MTNEEFEQRLKQIDPFYKYSDSYGDGKYQRQEEMIYRLKSQCNEEQKKILDNYILN
jgi:hypothetical protein